MADFAAVIRKTLANASETTPELRANIYEKARASVRRQIDAMATTPPQAAIDRQFQKLEDAINEVEAEYAVLDVQSASLEPEASAPIEPVVPVEPEPEVPSEPEPAPQVPEPEVPEPAKPEPEVTAPFDPSPQTPETPEPDAPVPPSLEANDSDVRGIMDEERAVQHTDEHSPVETAHFDEPSDAVEAVDDVTDGMIVGDSAISAPKAMDDRSSAEIETPVSNDAERFEPAAFEDDNFDEDIVDDDADGQASIDDVNRTIGELFGSSAVEPEVAKPTEAEDPLAEFLKEHEADFTAQPQDVDVSADSRTDEFLGDTARSVDTVSASVGDDLGAVEGERRESSAGIPPLMSSDAERKSSGGAKKATIAAIVLALLLGGAYAAYEKQDQLTAFYNESALPWWQDLTGGGDSSIGEAATTGEEGGVPVRTVTSTPVENGEEGGEEIAAANEESTPSAVEDVSDAEDAPTKFTQRLTEDGTEIDEGPIEGANTNEGSSVSSQTAGTADADTPAAEEGAATTDTPAPDATAETPATPVGQRAIFYEERTGSQDGTALAGATVWSVVNESPGGELPIEPAIRAETSIPELGLRMEMTIRRNGDSTFPASHIIELFFRVPENFDGRGIADVQRITFKNNEQDPGNALIAVPAPLDQNIFLIALTDATTAVETNVQLMTRESWIDIPMQYTNGRRALITLEKGIPGERVFKEVFDAWNANPINN